MAKGRKTVMDRGEVPVTNPVAEEALGAVLYTVQAYRVGAGGLLEPEQPRSVPSAADAVRMVERLSLVRAAVIAFSRTGDPDMNVYDDPVLLACAGAVPDELMEAMAP